MTARASTKSIQSVAPAVPSRVHTDLDNVQKPADIDIEPYVALAGGREFVFASVDDLPWDELGGIEGDGDEFFFKTLTPEDYEAFVELKLPGWKVNLLMTDYRAHYKLDDRRKPRRR